MNENINSLALSIHSMKKEEDLRLNAIESKQKTEEIIQKHLPKSIMYGLDQHEKDDSSYYVSDNCTIISIEIIGILDSVFNMTPKQTFEILRKIYLYFDDIIKKYPSLIIMKKNEQNIILCSGLFDFADQPKLQIAQSLNFCNEIINATDDLSEQLMLDITFNIAIVFGGPIAGNILCKSYPTFELVGNLLETVMVFLEDESIGIIKMNKEAMDLMDKREFVIDKEKEIREKNVKMFFVKKVLTK
ncbi:Adenylate and Guanylate cyclase catalytic domain containing protein [Histomonas meleagridis]|uniref:Adenylate and Guanylate cyclase catalytic domain containing protein n=1 Tax=Histomonas meleagridis TaxID=135588 RepID=UPI00355AC08F|nr:Adenylate and Guanylate cyclase catalytic domain containing protein [Histomonas meleagridis]KAH0799529.1 Adenylate and Guanylate cyclase catalytic domain containing protein [Histomonas meleagridis]